MGKKNPVQVFTEVVTDPGKALTNLVEPVVKTADKTITTVGKTVEAVAKNPLPVIETLALTAVGVPPTIAGAIVSAANGGTPEQVLKAAVFSSIPAAGEALATASGLSVAASTAIASAAVSVATGSSIEQAVVNGTISAAVSGSKPYVKAEISQLVSSPAVTEALTNATLSAEGTVLRGGSSDQVAQSIANSFTTSAIQATAKAVAPSTISATTNPDKFNAAQDSLAASNAMNASQDANSANATESDTSNSTPLDVLNSGNQPDPSTMSSAIALAGGVTTHDPDVTEQETLNSLYAKMQNENTQAGKNEVAAQIEAITGQPAIRNSGLDFNPDETTIQGQPIEASPLDAAFQAPSNAAPEDASSTDPFVYPKDTSVNANYSLSSTLTPKPGVDPTTGTGLTMSPLTVGAEDVGYSPVDYALADPSGLPYGVGLQMPDSPAIKAMGGAQGLTADVTNPVTGETGVVGGLGYTPSSALSALGDPSSFINRSNTIATDPAYLSASPLKASSDISMMPTGASSAPKAPKSTYAPKSSFGSPIDAAASLDSYLNSTGATDAAGLAQLKQLFPELTPDMAKILMERAGVTPSMLMSSSAPAADTQYAGSPYLSSSDLANIGQPDEFAQYAAKGGSMRPLKGHRPEFITGKTGHYAQGRGTGQSDDIPATLHDGDYVVDADTVAALGDGSSKAGAGALEHFRRGLPEHFSGGGQPIPAQIADGEYVLPAGFVTTLGKGSNKNGAKMLDAMREQIRAHKRSAPDTKIPPKARSPLQYMNEAMKG